MSITYVSRGRALDLVTARVDQVNIVLDLGAGIRPQTFIKPRVHICVDAHGPYLEHLRAHLGVNRRHVLINAEWHQFVPMLPDKAVDTVFALDFIEHLEKPEGLRMLREAERIARSQVVVYTPHGFFPQSYSDPSQPDRWGLDGGFWQTHRSGWDFDDFGDQWDIVCCPDFIRLDENNRPMPEPMGAIWAIKNVSAVPSAPGMPVPRRTTYDAVTAILQQGLPPVAFGALRTGWRALLDATHR